MMEGYFGKDDSNELLKKCYENRNYKSIHGLGNTGICYIFCSGNGLYFPDDYDTFIDTVLYKDRYEWENVAIHLVEVAEKIVFIRDIRKSWYVTGINDETDTMDRLIDLIREESKGYKTIVVGNSAGGYMAMLLGSMINAQAVFSWSGQVNLRDCENVVEEYFYLRKYSSEQEYTKYYDISSYLQEANVPIFYFYASKCITDINQFNYIRNFKNVFSFAIDSDVHGHGLAREAYLALLISTMDELLELWRDGGNKPWSASNLNDFIVSRCVNQKAHLVFYKKNNRISVKEKASIYKDLLIKWVAMKQNGQKILIEEEYKDSVAIWGSGPICDLLLNELQGETKIKNIIESIPTESMYKGIPVVSLDQVAEKVKLIIVIPFYDLEIIRDQICMRMDCRVLGIDEVLETASFYKCER